MDPQCWRQIEQLYFRALALEPAKREGFLIETCQRDHDLRRQVESLLPQSGSTAALVDRTAGSVVRDPGSTRTTLKADREWITRKQEVGPR